MVVSQKFRKYQITSQKKIRSKRKLKILISTQGLRMKKWTYLLTIKWKDLKNLCYNQRMSSLITMVD
jgi:hypothetical protein